MGMFDFKFNKNSNKNEQNKVIEELPIDMIRPNPYQPRKNFTEQSLEELCQSIKQYGLLQPINVRRTGNYYELIAGERRLRAAKLAGFKTIPSIIIDAYEQDSAIIAMIENLQRENLNFMEEAEGYVSLINDHGFTQEELAKKLGKSQSTIANKIRLLKLPESIKEEIKDNKLTERHARALLRLPDEETQLKVVKQIIQKNLNVKKTEELIEKQIQAMISKQEPEGQNNKKKKVIKLYKDVRLFINTMKNAVSAMTAVGVKAEYSQEDKGDRIEIKVVIPK